MLHSLLDCSVTKYPMYSIKVLFNINNNGCSVTLVDVVHAILHVYNNYNATCLTT